MNTEVTRQKSTHIHVSRASGEIQYLSSEMKKALDKIGTLSRPTRYKSYNKSNAILKSFHCSIVAHIHPTILMRLIPLIFIP